MSIQYFTNKLNDFQNRAVYETEGMPGAITMVPSANPTVTNFCGFGVAITGASCFLLDQMEKAERENLIKHIYSPEGINLSVGRLSIGSSDYCADLYSYDDVPFDTELKYFSIAKDEKYIIPMIKEILKVRPDIYLFASPWSPPGWMKTGGHLCGGYMREEYVDCYAEYITKYIKAYAEHGIKISSITPQNESETQQDGRMPACIWHPEIEAKFIKTLKTKLVENGLDVKIWIYDHNFSNTDRVMWQLDEIEGLKECCDGAAFHYYHGNVEQTLAIKEKYPEIELHFTEGGPRLYDNYDTDWCKWGLMISRALKCSYRSFTGWNLVLDEMGHPNIGPYYCGGLVTRNSITHELSYSGQYKAFWHIARHINAGSKIYPLQSNELDRSSISDYPNVKIKAEGFMIDNGENGKVIVLVNPSEDKKQVQVLVDGKYIYVELWPDSLSTVII